MNDLADVNMQGVKPAGDFKELVEGKYLVRIEDAGKKAVKDKFDKTTGAPDPDNGRNFMLAIDIKVYGGPDDGHTETEHLNLWNTNQDAVRIAKSTLAAIQQATGVYSPASKDFIGKWMIMEVYLNRANRLSKKFETAPAAMVQEYASAPLPAESKYVAPAGTPTATPAPAYNPTPAAAPAQPPAGYVAPTPPPAAPAAAGAGQLPSWAAKKSQ